MTLLLPANTKVHLALGFTDMRKGIDGLAMLVQGALRQDPFSGHSSCSEGARPICSRSCSGTGAVYACSPSGSSRAPSHGLRTSSPAGRWR